MVERTVSLDQLGEAIRRDLRKLDKEVVRGAIRRAAKRGADICRAAAPVAFEELRESVHDIPTEDGAIIRADAPHAAAVEHGSRPHMPPVKPLIRWVQLRGIQGLTGSRARPARAVVRALRAVRGIVKVNKQPVILTSAIERVAWAIAVKIKQRGTRPQPFMRISLPFCVLVLDEEITAALAAA
jgi:hypothetical protein